MEMISSPSVWINPYILYMYNPISISPRLVSCSGPRSDRELQRRLGSPWAGMPGRQLWSLWRWSAYSLPHLPSFRYCTVLDPRHSTSNRGVKARWDGPVGVVVLCYVGGKGGGFMTILYLFILFPSVPILIDPLRLCDNRSTHKKVLTDCFLWMSLKNT